MKDDEDSVIMAMKDRRKASGQEVADMKLRAKVYGAKTAEELRKAAMVQVTKPFMEQFPYKSCQRGLQGSAEFVGRAGCDKSAAEMPGTV